MGHEKPFSTRSYYRFFRSFSLHGVHNLYAVVIWHICSVDLIRVLRLQQFVIGILSTTIGLDWNSFQFFPPTAYRMECCNLHGVYNLHGMYSFEQHSIAIDSHENVMEQLSTSLNSVAQPFAALKSLCRALQMSRIHVSKKAILRSPHSNRASHTIWALRRCSTLHRVVFTILAETRKK